MRNNIFYYADYRTYLTDTLVARRAMGRGQRSRLAEHLRCHSAYVTQVLGGKVDFSLEQSEMINRFLGHSDDEAHYFLLLVQLARAGSVALRKYFKDQIDRFKKEKQELKNRLEFKRSLSLEDQMIYYSSWQFAVIHMMLMLPKYQRKEAIASELKVSMQKTNQILSFLVSCGLAVERSGLYQVGEQSIHLGGDSPLLSKHHTNWRMRAISSLDKSGSHEDDLEDLHYSSIVSIAKSDIDSVRKILVQAIEQIRGVVKDSKEDSVYCYSFDLFEVAGE